MNGNDSNSQNHHVPVTPLSRFGMGEIGKPTYPHMYSGSVGTTSIVGIRSNPNRVSLIMSNLSGSTLYFGFSPGVSSSFGHILDANGGVFEMSAREIGEAVSTDIYTVASSGTVTLTVTEIILQEG